MSPAGETEFTVPQEVGNEVMSLAYPTGVYSPVDDGHSVLHLIH